MRRHTKNRCMWFFLLMTCVTVYFLYTAEYDEDHKLVYLSVIPGLPETVDRWAAIKGGHVAVEVHDDDEEFADNLYAHIAPPESMAASEQGKVERRVIQTPSPVHKREITVKPDERQKLKHIEITEEPHHKRRVHPGNKHQTHSKTTHDATKKTLVTAETTTIGTTTEIMTTTDKEKVHAHQHTRTHSHAHAHAQHPASSELETSAADLIEKTVHMMHGESKVVAEDHSKHQKHGEQFEPSVIEAEAEPVEQPILEQIVQQPVFEQAMENPIVEHVKEHIEHVKYSHHSHHEHEVHGHHTNKSAESHVTPPRVDNDNQVSWTPEQLLLGNNSDVKAAIEDTLLALGDEAHLEMLNRNITETSETRRAKTKVAMNETKPTNEELHLQLVEYLPEAPRTMHERVNWEKFFSFIPNGLQSCTELFPNLAHQNPLPQDFQNAYIDFQNNISPLNIKDNNIAEHLEQFIVYYFLVRAPFVKTICETGFGAGHSAFLWLKANPDVKVYTFDLGIRDYSIPIAEYLQARFPGRLNVIWGDSVNTLPMFRQGHKDVTCDIVVIDGGHTFRESFADYFHLRQMVTKNNIVLLDNYPDVSKDYMEILGAVWEGGKRRGEINEIFHCDYRPHVHGFSVGRFIPYSLSLHESENGARNE